MKKQETKLIVEEIMRNRPETRSDDHLLYCQVIQNINPEIALKSFFYVMNKVKEFGLPPFETVRRYRQRIQATDKSLAADNTTQAYREMEKDKYLEIART